MTIEIDISIVTYNSSKWIDDFFCSLERQDYPLPYLNIYVTDNGSSDDTILKLLDIRSSSRFKSFEVSQSTNTGFGSAHNNNVAKSKSEFILISNIDLTFEADSIIQIINTAVASQDNVGSWEMRQKPFEHPKHYNPVTMETSWSSSACLLVRRVAYETVGGYDEVFFMYGEDVDLSWRLRTAGFSLLYTPKAVCWHHTYSEGTFKKTQFLGSSLGNLYLRARFGSEEDMLRGESAYKQLIERGNVDYEDQVSDLWDNWRTYQRNLPHFNQPTFKDGKIAKFVGAWDYEYTRDGSFYQYHAPITANPLVSVIIRTYQGRKTLLECAIRSVLNQTYKNIEILVVEDGGNTLESTANEFSQIGRIRYISAPKVGRCATGNMALAESAGEFISFLDDDDCYYADHVETLLTELLQNQSIGLAYASSFELKMDYSDSLRRPSGFEITETNARHHRESFNHFALLSKNLFPIQSALFKRELFHNCGGFSVELDNLEDWNLWTKFSTQTSFLHIPKTTSIFRVPANYDTAEARSKKISEYYNAALDAQENLFFSHLNVAKARKEHLVHLEKERIEICILNKAIQDYRSELNERQRHERALGDHIAELENINRSLELQVAGFVNSTSWRITRPLRLALAKLRPR